MKTHFAKLRGLTTSSSVAGPLLFFVAFLCFAWGWGGWAFIPSVLGILLLCAFPFEIVVSDRLEESDEKLNRWVGLLAMLLFVTWIASMPEFVPFIDRLYSSDSMRDWRLILAVFIWSCRWSYSNYRKARALKDGEIVAIFADDTRQLKIEAEQDDDQTPPAVID